MYVAIADFLFTPFFFGFAIWSVFYVLTKRESIAGYNIDKTDTFIVRAVIFLGILHALFFIINGIAHGIDVDRAFGEYWFGFWIYPITYVGLMQLLWIKTIRKRKIVRIVMALWVFMVIQLEKLIIIATSFHRDFESDDNHWITLLGYFVLNMLISLAIFVALVVAGLEIKSTITKRK